MCHTFSLPGKRAPDGQPPASIPMRCLLTSLPFSTPLVSLSCLAAGVFVWRKDMLLIKATNEQTWGWQLLGFLQHDSWGQPAFIHRTIDKFNPHGDPWIMQLITAPMPIRCVEL